MVEKYKFNVNSANYTFKQMLSIAGFEKSIIEKVSCEINDGFFLFTFFNITIQFNNPDCNIIDQLLYEKINFTKIRSFDNKRDVPVIINSGLKVYEYKEKSIIINADFLPLSFILLSRIEEILISKKDKFGRFEYNSSLSYKYDLIEIPIVDEYALILREIIVKKTGIRCDNKKSKCIISQDLDYIFRFSNFFKSIASISREVLYKKSIITSFNSINSFFNSFFNYKNDPYLFGIKKIINEVHDLDIEIQLYFMTYYLNYKNNNVLNEIFKYIKKSNSKISIGIHPNLNSYNDQVVFDNEVNVFKSFFNYVPQFIRQHYLQINVGQTFNYIDNHFIKIDSSLGYVEREGFRCGTSHLYQPYNFESECAFSVSEQPLIVMDTTLSDYRKLTTLDALKKMIKLYNSILAVNGNFVILWHNNNVTQNKLFSDNVLFRFIEYYKFQSKLNT
jgi:hypothetical protein